MNQQAGLNLLPTEGKAKTRIYMFVLIFSRAGLSQQRDHGGGEISYWAPDNSPSPPTVFTRRRSAVILRRRMNPVCLIHLRLVNKRFWPAQTSVSTQQCGGLKVSFSIFQTWTLYLHVWMCKWIMEMIRGEICEDLPPVEFFFRTNKEAARHQRNR